MLKLENSKNIQGWVNSPKGEKSLREANAEILSKAMCSAVTARECAEAKPLIESFAKTAQTLGYDLDKVTVKVDVQEVVLGRNSIVRWYRDFVAKNTLKNVLARVTLAEAIRKLVDSFVETTDVSVRSTYEGQKRAKSVKSSVVDTSEAF